MTRIITPFAMKPQPEATSQFIMTDLSKATPPESTKENLGKSPVQELDYSRLRFSGNKSFMETWSEASKANEEVAKFANEELSSLRALKMIHTVSPFLLFVCNYALPYFSSPQAHDLR